MATDVVRVKPLEAQKPRAGASAFGLRRDLCNPLFEFRRERFSLLATPGNLPDPANIPPDVLERVRRQGENARLFGQSRESRCQVTGECGADMTEVLGNDEIG